MTNLVSSEKLKIEEIGITLVAKLKYLCHEISIYTHNQTKKLGTEITITWTTIVALRGLLKGTISKHPNRKTFMTYEADILPLNQKTETRMGVTHQRMKRKHWICSNRNQKYYTNYLYLMQKQLSITFN